MVVIPQGLLSRPQVDPAQASAGVSAFAEDPEARRESELKAMEAVMVPNALGNQPSDVSAQKVGYDISSYDPRTQHLRFIEVKGSIDGADTVMLTRQEIITRCTSLKKYIPGYRADRGWICQRPVRGRWRIMKPAFEHTAIQIPLEAPAGAGRGTSMKLRNF